MDVSAVITWVTSSHQIKTWDSGAVFSRAVLVQGGSHGKLLGTSELAIEFKCKSGDSLRFLKNVSEFLDSLGM